MLKAKFYHIELRKIFRDDRRVRAIKRMIMDKKVRIITRRRLIKDGADLLPKMECAPFDIAGLRGWNYHTINR
jgi:hypothetical protein